MTPEQQEHCADNANSFTINYVSKYQAGQKSHGGNMWEMGAYQALENMESEVLDQWSYVRQIRKVLDEIKEVTETEHSDDECLMDAIKEILNRVKEES